jgi:hypothetical protein
MRSSAVSTFASLAARGWQRGAVSQGVLELALTAPAPRLRVGADGDQPVPVGPDRPIGDDRHLRPFGRGDRS